MDQLVIEKSNALKAYCNADNNGKVLLENLLGKKVFLQKITDRVKTFEDACAVLGIDPNEALVMTFSPTLSVDKISCLAYIKLIIIARALNEGWTPDWSDSSQYKYVPWFKHQSGSGLSYDVYDYWLAFTGVGSRLCFKSAELAEYAGRQFEPEFRDYLTL
jgi:hypothetical protein